MSQTIVAGQIQRVIPRHFKVIDMAVAGHDNKVIAETLSMSIGQVNLILRSPIAQSEIARIRKESTEAEVMGLDRSAALGKARSIIEQASVAAATTLENELLAEKPEVRIKAANSILDRAIGGGKDDRRASVINITGEQIALINLALKESEHVKLLPTHQASAHSPEVRSVDVPKASGTEDGSADETTAHGAGIEPCDVLEDHSSHPEA